MFAEYDDVNYGACSDREEAAAAGLRFYGSAGDGCEYDGCEFAGFGGRMFEVESSHSGLVVPIDPETLRVSRRALATARGYLRAKKAVHQNATPPTRKGRYTTDGGTRDERLRTTD